MKSEFDASAIACRVAKSGSLFETFLDKKSLAAGVLALSPGRRIRKSRTHQTRFIT